MCIRDRPLVSVVEDPAEPGVWVTEVEGREPERIAARRDVHTSVEGSDVLVSTPGGTWLLSKRDAVRSAAQKEAGSGTTLVSPMPGTVIVHSVAEGARVEPGDAVLAVEAMKMEHVLRAEVAGTVAFSCQVGEQVPGGQVLATITPDHDPEQ